MWRVTKKLFKALTAKQKRNMILLSILMLIGGMIESLSVSLILPLGTAMVQQDEWREEWYAKIVCGVFNVNDQRSYIKVILILLIVVFLFKNAYLLFEYYCQYTFIAKSRYTTQKKLIRAYISKPYDFYLSADSGKIIRIVTHDTVEMFNLLTSALQLYTEIIVAAVLGITIIAISPYIAIRMIIILLVELILITYVIKPILRRLGSKQRSENAIANKWLLQSINGIKSIKVSHTERFFEDNYSTHAKVMVDTQRMNQTLSNMPRLLIEAFTMAGALLVIFFMVQRGTELSAIFPQLSAFVVATVRLLPSVNRISTSINAITFAEGGLDNVMAILKENEKAAKQEDKLICDRTASLTFDESLSFDNVTYKYPATDKLIFNDACFQIKPGQSIGIVGTSGAGKTTAIDLILGLLKPEKGRISVDGTDIECNLNDWLSHVSYIPQNIYLLDDTIRANVAFGKYGEEVREEEVWKALEDAQMKEFVCGLPNGLDTGVGEQGIRLSGGQRQRIGIARALYSNPDILFFDEATSALDVDTESAIMEAIDNLKGRKTLVIIAHRLSTIENCDVIYKIENGKVNRRE